MIFLITFLLFSTSANGRQTDTKATLIETYLSCSPADESKDSMDCLTRKRIATTACRSSASISCPIETTKMFFSNNSNCDFHLISFINSKDLSFKIPLIDRKQKKVCQIPPFEFQTTDDTWPYIPIGHAKLGKDGKWVVPPPQIPIALRSFITPKNIVVNEITQREPFLLGKGRHYETARDSDICNPTFRSFTHRPGKLNDGTVHVYFSLRDPDEVEAANAVAKAWGLEQSDDFLRNDRHVIGRSRDFNYTVVSTFTPKNDLKICGRTIPKGTMLKLSTYLNERTSTCEIGADGVLFLLGIPNTEKKSEPGKEPTKTLTCVPKAYFSGNFKHAMNKYISSKNSGKAEVPTKPLVDFNDCECMAKELEPEEWRD